jgi:hypothetical protein
MLLWDHRTKSLEQAEAFLDDVLDQPNNLDLAKRVGRAARIPASVSARELGSFNGS